MKSETPTLLLSRLLRNIAVILIITAAPLVHAATIWTGPAMTFNQSTNSTDVLIPGVVSLTRAFNHWLYNPAGGDTGPVPGTPSNTQWAFAPAPLGTNATLADVTGLSYASFDSYRNGDLSGVLLPNKQMVIHIITQDIYVPVMFTAWPHGGGAFAYVRATPPPTAPAPTVSITNPVNTATFVAPATFQIDAVAAVTSGSVTNVAFFANGSPLGADQTAPFNVSSGGLAAGAYALTAVATAGGISTTSAVVNVTVLAPGVITLSSPQIATGQFSFDYTATVGLDYVVENSSNLLVWTALTTNAATTNLVHYSDPVVPNSSRYYRVGRIVP